MCEEAVGTKKLTEKEIEREIEKIIEGNKNIKSNSRKLSAEERASISLILKEGRKGKK